MSAGRHGPAEWRAALAHSPVAVRGFGRGSPRRAVMVAAGLDHTVVVTDGGELFSWGAATAPLGYEVSAAAGGSEPGRESAAAGAAVGVAGRDGGKQGHQLTPRR